MGDLAGLHLGRDRVAYRSFHPRDASAILSKQTIHPPCWSPPSQARRWPGSQLTTGRKKAGTRCRTGWPLYVL